MTRLRESVCSVPCRDFFSCWSAWFKTEKI